MNGGVWARIEIAANKRRQRIESDVSRRAKRTPQLRDLIENVQRLSEGVRSVLRMANANLFVRYLRQFDVGERRIPEDVTVDDAVALRLVFGATQLLAGPSAKECNLCNVALLRSLKVCFREFLNISESTRTRRKRSRE